IVGGCIDGGHNQSVVCSKQGSPLQNVNSASYGSGVYATNYSSTQNDIAKPTIDTNWYSNARPGPATGCNDDPTNSANRSSYPSDSQSGTPQWSAATFKSTVFDNNTTRNTSLATNPIDILQLVNNWNQVMNSFDCRYYGPDGTLLGRLAWTYPAGGMTSSNPGTLIIQGTVFIDGNLNFASSDYAVYQGRGTIYVNGKVTITAGAKICAQPISGSPCNGNFDPNTNLLEIVAINAGNANPGFSLTGSGTYEGVSFVNGVFNASASSNVNGPVIADRATMSGNAKLRTTVDPPSGAPGAATTTTTTGSPQATWAVVPGSWQQLK